MRKEKRKENRKETRSEMKEGENIERETQRDRKTKKQKEKGERGKRPRQTTGECLKGSLRLVHGAVSGTC